MSWYDKIKSIKAEGGFVYIITSSEMDNVVIPVDEAMDRALCINQMVAEEHYKELGNKLMHCAWEATQQIKEMSKEDQGSFDYLKAENLRIMIAYGKHRRI